MSSHIVIGILLDYDYISDIKVISSNLSLEKAVELQDSLAEKNQNYYISAMEYTRAVDALLRNWISENIDMFIISYNMISFEIAKERLKNYIIDRATQIANSPSIKEGIDTVLKDLNETDKTIKVEKNPFKYKPLDYYIKPPIKPEYYLYNFYVLDTRINPI